MTGSTKGFGIPSKSSQEIRSAFIEFFKAQAHKFVPSAPVAPMDDPTLLFTNAGMNQFKPIFLGDNREGLKRAVNSQKCVRVSGKHNDLDEVGRDGTHHTFFEMLGTWSFGDYYKKEAIKWHWQFYTEVMKLPKERVFVSIFRDDDEAFEIWKSETDIEPWRILRFGEKENFWEMGEVGPCGPCSEMHFDLGDLATQKNVYKDPVGGVNGSDFRFLEFNNLVFIQYERLQNGSLKPLKDKHVDTGGGLERLCSIVQNVGNNYDTDLFTPITNKIASLTGKPYQKGEAGTPHRVIADHLRMLSFAIADGVTPGNEGRGYVLRRVLRRASRFSQDLDQNEPFIFKLVPTLVEVMGSAFPELAERASYIAQVIESEEQRFMRTLKDGLSRFAKIADATKKKQAKQIDGKDAFLLADTYGFPVDLTGVLAAEQGLSVDQAGFNACMEEQRERARGAQKFDASFASEEGWTILTPGSETSFVGYDRGGCSEVAVKVLRYREVGDEILICLDKTPFYAESGGQVGDQGTIIGPKISLRVEDSFKILDMHVHRCSLISGLLNKDNLTGLKATVDMEKRLATMRHHSATHLLHAALRTVLGDHVQQQGSLVGPERLRFDFTHPTALTDEQINAIERMVNDQIFANLSIAAVEKPIADAKKEGAVALFGEKYGDVVRTIKMGGFSYELCGGTHAESTGQIGAFVITSETSIAAGIRRLEALSGHAAINLVRTQSSLLQSIGRTLKVTPDQAPAKVEELVAKQKDTEKEMKSLQQAQVNARADSMIRDSGKLVKGTTVIVHQLDAREFPRDSHQMLLESLAGKLGNGVAVLTHVEEGTLSLLSAVGKDAQAKVKAGDLIKELAKLVDGRGGGRPDRAQAGSKHPEKEPLVRQEAEKYLSEKL